MSDPFQKNPNPEQNPDPQQQPYQQHPYQQQPPPYQQQPPYQQPPGGGYGFPAAPPPPQGPVTGPGGLVFDNASGLYLPPGTELASVGRRIGAYFLSLLLVIVTLVIGYVIWGLIAWGKGTTPALQVLKMKVWRTDGRGVAGFGRMALREIIGRLVDGIVGAITSVISFVLFVTTGKHQALHDMVAGTTVLYDPNKVLG